MPSVLNLKALGLPLASLISPDGVPLLDGPSVYVGRLQGPHHFGNPFTHRTETGALWIVSSRTAAIECYEDWLFTDGHHRHSASAFAMVSDPLRARRFWILSSLRTLRGKDLICWCAPQACHGDILLERANA